jgi:type II secretory pathway predicted ATPase ExeA
VWKRYWQLSADPFHGASVPYVPLPGHQDAVARLIDTIETGQGRAVVQAAAGLGKSRILARALAETRSPTRRAVWLSSPSDGPALLAGLAEGLGRRVVTSASRAMSWRALTEAVRLCRWQRLRVVLVIDDCQHLTGCADRLDLERLMHLDPHPEARVTVLEAHRTDPNREPEPQSAAPWVLRVQLHALTRSDVEIYLTTKLAAAGRAGPAFTTWAINRLHATSAGCPRTLDRLATLALMAGAVRGLEMVTPDVVDAVAPECIAEISLA